MAFFLYLLFPLLAQADLCTPGTPKGEKCRIAIREIRPIQFSVGLVDVRAKQAILQKGKKKKFLKANRAHLVIGPGGTYYLIDRHHLTHAAHLEGVKETYAEIVDNLGHLSEQEFWKTMQERHWVHLKDGQGRPRTLGELPRHVRELTDDPYRSLAWIVRNSKGFEKTKIPFAEFEWADYFRNRIEIGRGRKGWAQAVKEAIRLAAETVAELPGRIAVPPHKVKMHGAACWKQFKSLSLTYR